MELNWKEIGLRIKKMREANNLTQTDLASKIGKTESSVRKYESGLTEIPLSVLSKISSILDIKLDVILGLNLGYIQKQSFEKWMNLFSQSDDDQIKSFFKMLDGHESLAELYKDMTATERINALKDVATYGIGFMRLKALMRGNSYTLEQKKELEELMINVESFYSSIIDTLYDKVQNK